MRQQARILDQLHCTIGSIDVILDVRDRTDQIEIELALQALAHDLHVQQTEEAAAEAKAQRHRRLRLIVQRGVIQLQLGEGVPQLLVLLGVGGVEAREHHGLDVAVARQQVDAAMLRIEHGVTGPGLAHATHVGDDVADFAGLELFCRLVPQLEIADFVDFVDVVTVRAEGDLHPRFDHAVHDADRGDRAAIAVVVGVEDQGAHGGFVIAAGRRNAGDHGLQQLRDTPPLFGRDPQDLLGLDADEVVDFVRPLVRLGARQIDFVEDGYDFQARIHREQQIGQCLSLNSLGCIHDQNCALAGGQRP